MQAVQMDTIPFHWDTPDALQCLGMACLCPDECHEGFWPNIPHLPKLPLSEYCRRPIVRQDTDFPVRLEGIRGKSQARGEPSGELPAAFEL